MNTSIQQGHIKLIKGDSKDFYIVTKIYQMDAVHHQRMLNKWSVSMKY